MKQQVKVWFLCMTVLAFLYGCGGGQQQSQTPTQTPAQTANQDPKALITLPGTSLMSGTVIAFDGSKSTDPDGKITKYAWEFSDGTKMEGAKVSHTFTDPGSYEIKLTVTDDKNKSITTTQTVAVGDAAASERDEHLRLSQGTRVRIPITAEPRYFLPNATEGTWESSISSLVFDAMTQVDTKLESNPSLATSWDWNPDELTFTFHLRPGAKFHDGEVVNCEDVLFSFKAWIHPKYPGPRYGNFSGIVGADEFRNNIFASLDMSDDLKENLDSGSIPQAVRDAFGKYGITLADTATVAVERLEPEGEEPVTFWAITDSETQKRYEAHADKGKLTLHLPDDETLAWPIPGLKCVDSETFWVKLKEVQRTFPLYAAGSGIMPKHIYEPYLEANGYDKLQGAELEMGQFVGTGPYKFAQWEPGQYIKLVRNDNYWQSRRAEFPGQSVLSGVEELYFIVVPDPSTQMAKLLADEVDVLDTRGNISQHFELQGNADFTTYVYPQLTYDYWHWNLRNPLFQDVKVRQAMCYALDRQEMVNQVLKGLGDLANGPTNPLRWDWDPTLAEVHPQYNPVKTIELMEQAGWAIEKNADGTIKKDAVWTKTVNGETLRMEFEIVTNQGNNRRNDFMLLMQEQLGAIGFKTSTRTLDANAFYNDYLDGTHAFETAIAGWRMGVDPDGTSLWHSKSIDTAFNWMAYVNPEVDRLNEEGLTYATPDEAKPTYQKMNKILVETQGYCWLAFPSATFAARSDLKGLFPLSPLDPYALLFDWYYDGKGIPVTVETTSTN